MNLYELGRLAAKYIGNDPQLSSILSSVAKTQQPEPQYQPGYQFPQQFQQAAQNFTDTSIPVGAAQAVMGGGRAVGNALQAPITGQYPAGRLGDIARGTMQTPQNTGQDFISNLNPVTYWNKAMAPYLQAVGQTAQTMAAGPQMVGNRLLSILQNPARAGSQLIQGAASSGLATGAQMGQGINQMAKAFQPGTGDWGQDIGSIPGRLGNFAGGAIQYGGAAATLPFSMGTGALLGLDETKEAGQALGWLPQFLKEQAQKLYGQNGQPGAFQQAGAVPGVPAALTNAMGSFAQNTAPPAAEFSGRMATMRALSAMKPLAQGAWNKFSEMTSPSQYAPPRVRALPYPGATQPQEVPLDEQQWQAQPVGKDFSEEGYKGGLSEGIINSNVFRGYAVPGTGVFGYIGSWKRNASRDRVVEQVLRDQGLSDEGIATWLTSGDGRRMMDDPPRGSGAEFKAHVESYTKNAKANALKWTVEDLLNPSQLVETSGARKNGENIIYGTPIETAKLSLDPSILSTADYKKAESKARNISWLEFKKWLGFHQESKSALINSGLGTMEGINIWFNRIKNGFTSDDFNPL
jgi:hypothetical protein